MLEDRPVDDDLVESIRTAETLSELADVVGVDSEDEAYFLAKRAWAETRHRDQETVSAPDGLPGDCVVVDGREFHVHGITHAGTPEERAFLRDHVSDFLERDAVVYCEQGIRPIYFDDYPAVRAMDDYHWAMNACTELDSDSDLPALAGATVDGLLENLTSVATEVRNITFALIDSGGDIYGDRFKRALGDVAAAFLMRPEDLATGDDFESFTLHRKAARNPERLSELQRYYHWRFLPQPLEREWLRSHDPELEIISHARNERMADYVIYHAETADEIHLIVGAAHQPGVVYYLEAYRDGRDLPTDFELF